MPHVAPEIQVVGVPSSNWILRHVTATAQRMLASSLGDRAWRELTSFRLPSRTRDTSPKISP